MQKDDKFTNSLKCFEYLSNWPFKTAFVQSHRFTSYQPWSVCWLRRLHTDFWPWQSLQDVLVHLPWSIGVERAKSLPWLAMAHGTVKICWRLFLPSHKGCVKARDIFQFTDHKVFIQKILLSTPHHKQRVRNERGASLVFCFRKFFLSCFDGTPCS